MENLYSPQSTGKGIMNSEDVTDGYLVFESKNCRNIVAVE